MRLLLPIALSAFAVSQGAQAAECGTLATQGRIDEAARQVVANAVLADVEGRPQDGTRFAPRDGAEPMLRALSRLPQGWLAGPDLEAARSPGIWSLNRSGLTDDVMLVRMGDGETAHSRRIHLACRGGRWVITWIVRDPEGDDWDDLLAGG